MQLIIVYAIQAALAALLLLGIWLQDHLKTRKAQRDYELRRHAREARWRSAGV
jgi:hypothetical protein